MHPIRSAICATLALGLAACATLPAGEDPEGQQLKAAAMPVLHALIRHHKERGYYPQSLHELPPRYLPAVPFHPGLRYDRDTGVIDFFYEGPFIGKVVCMARVGGVEWTCR